MCVLYIYIWIYIYRKHVYGQAIDGKSEFQIFRNQWTKMDRNGLV